MKHSFIKFIFSAVLVLGLSLAGSHVALAASVNVTGWAWSYMPNGSNQAVTLSNPQSGQGLGWISLDSGNGGSVTFDTTTGQFGGYGWSPYGGWLAFNPGGSYPASPNHGVQIDPTCLADTAQATCPVTGWARFLAGTGNNPSAGGWDGWVSMSGTGYGVTFTKATQQLSGNAWGDDVVGWVGFNAIVPIVPVDIPGCMTVGNSNYNPNATVDDGSCAPDDNTCTGTNGNGGTMQVPWPNGTPKPYTCEQLTCNTPSGNTLVPFPYYAADYPGVLPPQCTCEGNPTYPGCIIVDPFCDLYPNDPLCVETPPPPGGPLKPIIKEN